jgi:pimeloyl-ACP methyl ester carboxylesterase
MDVTIDPLEPENRFYRVTKDDLGNGPGHLIRSEALSGDAALEAASINYRVIYESTSGVGGRLGEPIGVSGIIAFPTTPPPAAGWPVISWAHGTVGSADKCAPSMDSKALGPPADSGIGLLRKINKAPHRMLNAFLNAGWAVAMTDYEGLGTYGNHPYLLGESEGRGILDIVPVARQFGQPVSDRYAIVGHSQGGQAALFGAHLAYRDDYTRSGTLVAVAALAPASNIGIGLRAIYTSAAPFGDLGAFYPLFSNGAFGGDPSIDKTQIFQDWALEKYLADYDTKARAEMTDDPEWMTTPPLAQPDPSKGIFRTQVGDIARITAWVKYWAQVDGFTPAKKITVPIRISQAAGDKRVNAANTAILVGQLNAITDHGPIEFVEYPNEQVQFLAIPDPETLGDHFGLLVDDTEINDLVGWLRTWLTGQA